jgi:hypothetical protein
MAISREEFESWGFRWPATTTERMPDGGTLAIDPTGYFKSRESWVGSERGRKFLREYVVRFANGFVLGPVHEVRVEELLGIADQA